MDTTENDALAAADAAEPTQAMQTHIETAPNTPENIMAKLVDAADNPPANTTTRGANLNIKSTPMMDGITVLTDHGQHDEQATARLTAGFTPLTDPRTTQS